LLKSSDSWNAIDSGSKVLVPRTLAGRTPAQAFAAKAQGRTHC